MQRNILEYLDETVKKVPGKIAFSGEKSSMTFEQLSSCSARIASWLVRHRVYKQPVAVWMEKSPEAVAAFLGIVRAGCYYVPLEPEMPLTRMERVLEHTSVKVLVRDEDAKQLPEECQKELTVVSLQTMCGTAVEEKKLWEIREKGIDTDPVYIMFTSGSTGMPKGVVGCHRNVIDYIDALTEVLELDETCIFACQASFCADASLREIYAAIKLGATVYLISPRYFMMPSLLMDFLYEKHVNTLCWAVSALTILSCTGALQERHLPELKKVAFVGEVFPGKQFEIWQAEYPETAFTNLYGPTEGTGVCCYYPVKRNFSAQEAIPIGFPFPNTEILLLDERGERCREGEICIRGAGVTPGYYLDRERTGAAYIENPANPFYPEIIYKTGDIGRYNAEGALLFLGRKDAQIKHMGHRIEPGEIEYCASLMDKTVRSCCVYDRKREQLVLFYEGVCPEEKMSGYLRENLVRYMFPSRIIRLAHMPLTGNCKTDRKKLEDMANGEID